MLEFISADSETVIIEILTSLVYHPKFFAIA